MPQLSTTAMATVPTPASTDVARLLSLIAHELRSPLSVTAGYIKMLASERPGPLNDAQRHQVRGADRSCGNLTTLAADISLLGRLERGEVTPQRTAIDLAALVAEVIAAHPVSPDHPVIIEAAPPASEPGASEAAADSRAAGGIAPDAAAGAGTDADADMAPDGAAERVAATSLQADPSHLRRAIAAMLAAVVRAAPDEATLQVAWRTSHAASGAQEGDARSAEDAPRAAPLVLAVAVINQVDDLLDAETTALDPLDISLGGLGVVLPLAQQLMALADGVIHATPSRPLGLRLTLPRAAGLTVAPADTAARGPARADEAAADAGPPDTAAGTTTTSRTPPEAN